MVRQRENFLVLMNNYNQVLEAQAIASDSAGLATERYEIYMNGLEATTNRFTAALEQMWMKTIDSDLIKWFIDLGTSVLTLVNNVGGLTPVFAALAVALLVLKFSNVLAGLKSIEVALNTAAIAVRAFTATTIASHAAMTFGISLLVAGIIGLGVVLYNNSKKVEKYTSNIEGLDSAISSLESSIKESWDSIRAIDKLGQEFEKLDSILERNSDQQERWLEIQKELKVIVPEINGYYDETGNFLLTEGTNLQTVNAFMKERIRLLKEEASIKKELKIEEETALLAELERKLIQATKKYNEFIVAEKKRGEVGFTIGGVSTETMDRNAILQMEELSDSVEDASRAVELAKISLGLLTLEESSFADAIEETIPSLDEQIMALDELSEAADKSRDAFASSANMAKSLIESYDEYGIISLSQVEQLRKEFPEEYTKALYLEGDQIRLNTEVLKGLVLARAVASVENQKQMIVSIGLEIQEAETALVTASTIVEANNIIAVSENAIGETYYMTAVAATNSANDQIAAKRAVLQALGEDLSSAQAGLKVAEAYVGQLRSGSFWAKDMASAVSGGGGLSEGQKAYNDLLKITISMLKQKKNDEKDALQDQLDGYKKIINAQKKLIDLKEEERDYNNELADKNKELADIDAELLQIQFDNSESANARRLELEDEKADKIEEIGEFQNDRSVELQKSALDEEYDQYEEFIDKKIKIIDDYLEKTGLINKEAMDLIRGRSDSFYQSLLDWNRLYGDGIDATISRLWAQADAAAAAASAGGGGYGGYSSTADGEKTYVPPRKTKQDYYQDFSGSGSPYVSKRSGDRIVQSQYDALPDYHEGGMVGGLPGTKTGEIFAKLMKKEVVVNQQQMQRFMNNTLPNLTAMAGNNETIFHMPITVNGNLDKTVLPELEAMVMNTINKSWGNRGIKRSAKSFSI